jgi:hypothetical protein
MSGTGAESGLRSTSTLPIARTRRLHEGTSSRMVAALGGVSGGSWIYCAALSGIESRQPPKYRFKIAREYLLCRQTPLATSDVASFPFDHDLWTSTAASAELLKSSTRDLSRALLKAHFARDQKLQSPKNTFGSEDRLVEHFLRVGHYRWSRILRNRARHHRIGNQCHKALDIGVKA